MNISSGPTCPICSKETRNRICEDHGPIGAPNAEWWKPQESQHSRSMSSSADFEGYTDAFTLDDNALSVRGWASTAAGDPADDFMLVFGDWSARPTSMTLQRRPDVRSLHPDFANCSGFVCRFPIPPSGAMKSSRPALYPMLKGSQSSRPLPISRQLFDGQNALVVGREETPLSKIIRRHLPSLKVEHVFDVGANVGQSISHLRTAFPTATIHCFEPAPSTYATLLADHGSDNNVTFQNVALGERSGRIQFTNDANSTMNRASDKGSVSVEMQTLDQAMGKAGLNHIGYLKLDTEGHDLNVLTGAGTALSKVDLIECEVSANRYNTYHNAFIDIFSLLADSGFFLFHMFEQMMEWQDGGRPVLRRFNAVFINGNLVGSLDGIVHK